MQHSNTTSFVGVVDAGDLVLVQHAPHSEDVSTYVEGRARGYRTYGDYGDVILFQRPGDPPTIHRPIFRLLWNATAGGFDIPALRNLEKSEDWDSNRPTPFGFRAGDNVTLHNMSFKDVSTQFLVGRFARDVVAPRCTPENPCYITMGDNAAPNYDRVLIRHSWVMGRARGEIPWLGLLNLVLLGTYDWGDARVPANSWTSLGVVLLLLIGTPIVWEIIRVKRRERRALDTGPEEGGLGDVLSTVEERAKRRRESREEGAGDSTAQRSSSNHEPEDRAE